MVTTWPERRSKTHRRVNIQIEHSSSEHVVVVWCTESPLAQDVGGKSMRAPECAAYQTRNTAEHFLLRLMLSL